MAKDKISYFLDDLERGVISQIPLLNGIVDSKDSRKMVRTIIEIKNDVRSTKNTLEELKSRIPIQDIKTVIGVSVPDEQIQEQVMSYLLSAKIQGYTFINLVDTIQYTKDIRSCITTANKSLANKYLYLGAHGAGAWEKVERVLSIKQDASSLLRANIDHILEVASNDGRDSLDIVSLGSGTGGDDIEILDRIQQKNASAKTSYFAIDISVDLLRLGIGEVIQNAKSNLYFSKIDFHGVCIDIDELLPLRQYLSDNSKNAKKLFHLLGLTLGNNQEYEFLRNISRTMNEGDLLLLGLDFCVDDDEEFEKTFDSYKKAKSQVYEFLSGPLKMATKVVASQRGSLIKLEGYWEEEDKYDYLANNFGFHIGVEDGYQRSLSNIPETKTIARYYIECNSSTFDINSAKLCDLSNKYKSVSFKNWIDSQKDRLRLEIVGSLTEWKHGGQHLVLLRRL